MAGPFGPWRDQMPPAPVRIVRDLRLDLFRGLALLLIFLDHIPSNVISWVTVRNYGFSDATEIFIFISGYANAYVYGAAGLDRRRGLDPQPRLADLSRADFPVRRLYSGD